MDDLIPREYFIPTPPKETEDANKAERKKAEEAMPFLPGVISWFENAIDATDSLSTAREEAKRRNISVEVCVEAYDIVREILISKKGEFEALKQTFDK